MTSCRLSFLVLATTVSVAVPLAAQSQGTPVATRAAEVPVLTESPTVDRDGNVYFSELRAQKIYKLGTDGELTVFREKSHSANGLVIDPQQRLIACEGEVDGEPARVTRTDLKSGAVEVLADGYMGAPFRRPNDVTLDSQGRIYFSDSMGGAVYRIDGPGRIARILTKPDVELPNGLQVSPDDRTLYVIESGAAPSGPRMIRAFDLSADGTASRGRVIYNFEGRSADGMSIDVNGNLYVSAGLNRRPVPGAVATARAWPADALKTPGGVYVLSPAGKLLRFIPIDEDIIANNAFGGPDMKTLYVTSGRTLFKIQNDIAGLPR